MNKRTVYEDQSGPDRKRHLLRLWLSAPSIDEAMPRFSASEAPVLGV